MQLRDTDMIFSNCCAADSNQSQCHAISLSTSMNCDLPGNDAPIFAGSSCIKCVNTIAPLTFNFIQHKCNEFLIISFLCLVQAEVSALFLCRAHSSSSMQKRWKCLSKNHYPHKHMHVYICNEKDHISIVILFSFHSSMFSSSSSFGLLLQ